MGARAGHAVEVGRQVQRVAVDAGGVPALLVGEEDDDIGSFRTGGTHRSSQRRRSSENRVHIRVKRFTERYKRPYHRPAKVVNG